MSPTPPHALDARIHARLGALTLDVTVSLPAGTLAIVGPNGAGKTSLLLALLGALRPIAGHLRVHGQTLYDHAARLDVPLERRKIGYVPQDYALFPHLDAEHELTFALASACLGDRRDRRQTARELLARLGIAHLGRRRPATLSGGEKQRVALARALVIGPRALLLDEPLAALDLATRREVRTYLATTLRALAIPTLIVTHDPEDARALGDLVAVMEGGAIVQQGSFAALAADPRTPFVAALVGR